MSSGFQIYNTAPSAPSICVHVLLLWVMGEELQVRHPGGTGVHWALNAH